MPLGAYQGHPGALQGRDAADQASEAKPTLRPKKTPPHPARENGGRSHTDTKQLHEVKYNKMFNEQIRLSKYETATERRRGRESWGWGKIRETKEHQLGKKPGREWGEDQRPRGQELWSCKGRGQGTAGWTTKFKIVWP